ncbi:MAG: hypothetical protein K2L11_07685 [Muribaculaceae bacterium]|nr:hypothetical protein [Muribaculaceae bacterium]
MGEELTRADEDGFEGGLDEECYIDIDDLYVMTFSIEGDASELSSESKLLEVLWNGSGKGKSKGSGIHYSGNTVYLHTWLDHNIINYNPSSEKDFCLVAIANFKQFSRSEGGDVSLTKDMVFGDLQKALKYDFAPNSKVANGDTDEWYWQPFRDESGARNKTGIPLFGVKRVNLRHYDKTVHNFANPFLLMSNGSPTLWMMRAFAKIEVKLHPDLYDPEVTNTNIAITSACVDNNYASSFWVIPELERIEGFKNGNDYGTGETDDVLKIPGENFRSEKTTRSEQIQFAISEDGRSAVAYLPEYGLLQAQNNVPRIYLTLKIGDITENFNFAIKQYPDVSPEPACWQYLLRNHLYRFQVGLDFRIFSIDPMPWDNAFDNEFNFGSSTEDTQPDQTEQENTEDE